MSVAEAKQQIRKRMDFGIEHKPDYKEPWIAKAVLESYLTTRKFSWKVIKQAFEELVKEQVIYKPSSYYYAYVPESKEAKKTARLEEDLLNEIRRLTKEQGMAHITKDLGIPTDVHGQIQQPIAKETLAKLARSGIIYSPRPSYYAVTELTDESIPTVKALANVGDPVVWKGETYTILKREGPPWVYTLDRKPHYARVPQKELTSVEVARGVGREKTPHEEVRALLPEAKRLKDQLPASPFKSDFTTQILGLEAGLQRREIVRVEMENLKEAMKQARGRISRISETPLQRKAREVLKEVEGASP